LPDELAVASERAQRLRAALATLPDEQRAAVELQLAGWPGEQIAAALDRSPEAVRMLRHRAITRLRTFLADEDLTGGR
jgi:RNA polymerase sigma-70 factor, ECF subfamily